MPLPLSSCSPKHERRKQSGSVSNREVTVLFNSVSEVPAIVYCLELTHEAQPTLKKKIAPGHNTNRWDPWEPS